MLFLLFNLNIYIILHISIINKDKNNINRKIIISIIFFHSTYIILSAYQTYQLLYINFFIDPFVLYLYILKFSPFSSLMTFVDNKN